MTPSHRRAHDSVVPPAVCKLHPIVQRQWACPGRHQRNLERKASTARTALPLPFGCQGACYTVRRGGNELWFKWTHTFYIFLVESDFLAKLKFNLPHLTVEARLGPVRPSCSSTVKSTHGTQTKRVWIGMERLTLSFLTQRRVSKGRGAEQRA